MAKEIPIYKAYLDEADSDTGVREIAFTDDPAVMIKGVAFNRNSPKMRVAAPVLVPMNIYRCEDGYEYDVRFTADEVEKMMVDFQSKAKSTPYNLSHQTGVFAPAFTLENWIVEDPLTDKSFVTYGVSVPKGTWFAVSQVTDRQYFDSLVKNEQTGFSIEGFLGLKIIQNKQYKMNKQFKLADVKTSAGDMLFVDGEIAIDSEVFVIQSDGSKIVPEDGDVALEDGTSISIKDGVITEVATKEEEVAEVEVEQAAEPVVDEAPVEEVPEVIDEPIMGVSADEVAKMIDDKFAELVSKIAELQSKIDEGNTPVVEQSKPQLEVKMNFMERYRLFTNK